MNKVRRKQLEALTDKLNEIRAELESIMSDEEEYRDNMPENLQGSEKYEKADQACYDLQAALDSLEQAAADIEGSKE